MASIFLSYDRDNGTEAKSVARALEAAGHEVWWDQHIHGGAQFSKEIEQALEAAEAVVVLWSRESIESPWVRDEAAAGRDANKLVPVSIDGTDPPLGFRQFQTLLLSKGRISRARRHMLLNAVAAATGVQTPPPRHPRAIALPQARWLIAMLAVALVATGLFFWRPWQAGSREIVLAVAPATNDAASQKLASDLALKLAALNSSTALPIRVVEGTGKASFTLTTASAGPAAASLALKSGRESAILWSQDFSQPSGSHADLVQQLAVTAARIAGCTTEGLDGPVKLKPSVLRTYLNACAQLSEVTTENDAPPTVMLLDVLETSPRFTPAWEKLLLVEAELADLQSSAGERDHRIESDLNRHIAQARAVDPEIAEAKIAEAALMPSRNFSGRSEAITAAALQKPDNPALLMHLAGSLAATGRMRDAIEAADRAVQLDPLSPRIHSTFIGLLAYAGSFDAARRELAKAEKLWPGTASIADAQFRFHFRYGDPKIARALFEQQANVGGRGPRLVLAAREDPSPEKAKVLLDFVRERLRNMENPSAGIGFATLAFGQFGQPQDVIGALLSWPNADDVARVSEVLFRPEFEATRRDPRFLLIAKRAGLLDHWLNSGKWPDFCSAPGQTYDCRDEARRIAAAT